jgi:hypothetical protein
MRDSLAESVFCGKFSSADPQPRRQLSQFTCIRLDERYLLEARMIVTTSFENLNHAAVLSGSRLTLSPRRCNLFTKYRCN